MEKQLKYDLLLLVVALGWGFSFYFIDISLQYMGPFTLNAYRFILAFLLIGAIFFKRLEKPSKPTIMHSCLIGSVFFVMYASSNIGIMFTSLSNASFLPGLSVVFTPFLSAMIYKKKPENKLLLVVLLSVVGLAFLTLTDGFVINFHHILGDLLCILTGFANGLAIVLTGGAVVKKEVDSFQLGVYQLFVTGTLSLILTFIFEEPSVPAVPEAWFTVLFLALFCTGLALVLQPIALQYTTDDHVAVILALEPVFAGFVAYIFAGEVLTKIAYIGAIMMISSTFIMEFNFSKLRVSLFNKNEYKKPTRGNQEN